MITAQGIGSGLDVASIVSQLVAAEGQPTSLRLARREASIQSQLSALGSLKSALSQFRDALEPINDLDSFRSRQAKTSEPELFVAAATGDAVPSSYDIEVVRLAESQKIASDPFTSDDAVVGYGTLSIRLGPDTSNFFNVEILPEDVFVPQEPGDEAPPPSRTTLAAIRDAINAAPDNKGVGASIVNTDDGARLVLTSTVTGEANEIVISTTGGDGGLAVLEYGPDVVAPAFSELRAPADALIRIDSFDFRSEDNSINDAIDGVTINLNGAEEGTTAELTVEYNRSQAAGKVNEFVEAYNSLLDSLRSLSSYDAETQTASALLGDSTLREVATALRREVGGGAVQGYGFYRTLATVGITTDTDGKLSVDGDTLQAALSDDFDSVARLFADDDGFATRLDAVLEPFIGDDSRIDSRTDGLNSDIDLIADQREALNLRLASVEARLLRQFSALDGIISSLTSTSDFLAQQLNNLPNNNRG